MMHFPTDYNQADCVLAPINTRMVPFVAGRLAHWERRQPWADEADWRAGYNAIAELQVCMTKVCTRELLKRQDQLYRLLDASLMGTSYILAGTDPVTLEAIITPPIPDVPAMPALPGLVQRVSRLEALLDNAMNGTLYLEYDRVPSIRQELEQIKTQLTALETELNTKGELDDDMLAEMVSIVEALA